MTGTEVALIITAFGTSIMTPIIVAYYGQRNANKTDAVKQEVTPNNGKTAGQTMDMILSQGIINTPKELRTEPELLHQEAMALQEQDAGEKKKLEER